MNCYKSNTTELKIDTENYTVVINGVQHQFNGKTDNYTGRITFREYIAKYTGEKLLLYRNRILYDTLFLVQTQEDDVIKKKEPQVYLITIGKELVFDDDNKKITEKSTGNSFEVVDSEQIGPHIVYKTKDPLNNLFISLNNSTTYSMWRGAKIFPIKEPA